MSDTIEQVTIDRATGGWDRTGWFGDGLRTYPVAIGVIVVGALVAWGTDVVSIRPAPGWLRLVSVVAVISLAVLGRRLSASVLRSRDALVTARVGAASATLQAYAGLVAVLAVALGRLDAYPFALVMGALAMTSPGVFLVVLDGSPPRRAVVRVVLAAALVPVAVVVGYLIGFAAFFVSTFVGSVVFGVLAGHLTTFVPLALVGPGPHRVGAASDRPAVS